MILVVLIRPLNLLTGGVPLMDLLPSAFFPIVLIVLLVLVVHILWMIWSRPLPAAYRTLDMEHLPDGTSVMSRPLLSKSEATLLNLVRLAVQDRYLVFAKLPVSSLVKVTEQNEETRRTLLKTIQPVRVDVALIHPGTLSSAKVIKFVSGEDSPTQSNSRDRLVDAVLQAAGIEIIRLEPHSTYTVAKLVDMLGLGEPD